MNISYAMTAGANANYARAAASGLRQVLTIAGAADHYPEPLARRHTLSPGKTAEVREVLRQASADATNAAAYLGDTSFSSKAAPFGSGTAARVLAFEAGFVNELWGKFEGRTDNAASAFFTGQELFTLKKAQSSYESIADQVDATRGPVARGT